MFGYIRNVYVSEVKKENELHTLHYLLKNVGKKEDICNLFEFA